MKQNFKNSLTRGRRIVTASSKPSRTRQSFRDECDINLIMSKYSKNGGFELPTRPPVYADVYDTPDLQTAYEVMRDAEDAFMRLPSDLRKYLDNDPRRMLAEIESGDNLDVYRDFGILGPTPEISSTPDKPSAPPEGVPSSDLGGE